MALNKQKGNMYGFVTHTWNPLAGQCPHACTYCSTKKLSAQYPVIKTKYTGSPRIDEKQLKTYFGSGKTIFVAGQNDLFAQNINKSDIDRIIFHINNFPGNRYLFQTKNPKRVHEFDLPGNSILATTIETNRHLRGIMQNSPSPFDRSLWMATIYKYEKHITIEPIMDFDTDKLVKMIKTATVSQINIGADSGNNGLPEPNGQKIKNLISELKKLNIKIHLKDNLKRLMK